MEENKEFTSPEQNEQTKPADVENTTPKEPVEAEKKEAQETKPEPSKKDGKKPIDKKLWIILGAALAVILITVVVLIALGGNSNQPEETTPETTTVETTPEEVDPETPTAPSLKLTQVSITAGGSAAEQNALTELKKYLETKGVQVSNAGGFPITISIDESLGEDAYRVSAAVGESKTESLTIVGGNGRGVLYGVYQFLEKCADVRFFTPELEVCEPGDIYVTDGVILDYTPTFELRQTNWYNWIADDTKFAWSTKNGVNIISGWTNSWSEALGGSLTYAPDLFVHTISFLLADPTVAYPRTAPNPCLTDENVYNTVLANVRKILEANPDSKILSISQNDNEKHCACDNCKEIESIECSASGPLIRFVNRIANELADEYPDLTIDTLAYKYTLKAPKVTKPAENVCIRLSTITCHFNHPITQADCLTCANFCNAVKEWSAICDNLYVWDYTTNYAYYLATFPNFHVLRQNMKFFADNNVKGVFEQGNSSGPSGEFGELRAYLIAKLLMNPYMTSTEYYAHMDEFLAAYYGEGWQNIRKYIDAITLYAKTYPSSGYNGMGIYSFPFTVFTEENFATILDKMNGYWDAAEAAAGDRLEYVQRSRYQVRYLSLFVNPNKEEAQKLVDDVLANNIHWHEGEWGNWNDPKIGGLPWFVEQYDLLTRKPSEWFAKPKDEE